jgi:predicted CXXCH cytochrome family protein
LGWLVACGDSETSTPDSTTTGTARSEAEPAPPARPAAARRFVGSEQCIHCHPGEGARWRGSDHDRAMEELSPETVLGRFDGSTLQHFDRTWRFLHDESGYAIEVQDPGQPALRMKVAYTFGVDPIQQYLVERPGGRMQAPPVAWDARPEAAGGQRWIDLQPDERTPIGDPLHWDGLAYNWNSQCAVCHSTHLEKRYDAGTGHFDSRWAGLDVGCEACHGPGSEHVALHEAGGGPVTGGEGLAVVFDPWSPDAWQRSGEARIASRIEPPTHDVEIDVCAPCHSRRATLVDPPEIGAPFLDGHRPRLLDPDLYFADGQIRDEVYVWGSFLQSRMYAAGVRCSDCHDPHSLGLRREGNALCDGCHDRAVYDVKAHHGHAPGSAGAQCVSCHMPSRIYMQVDARRDHSFPIPRPDRSASLGVPNACESCHPDRGAKWAVAQIDSWRPSGAKRPTHWSDHLVEDGHARHDPQRWLEIALAMDLPPIVRANAWARLADEGDGGPSYEIVRARLREGTELERLALVDVARRYPPEMCIGLLRPLLDDDSKAVRVAATGALMQMPPESFRPADRSAFARGLREYRTVQDTNAERPEAQVNLGLLALVSGDLAGARVAYQRAIEEAPYFVPAYVNLADLDRMEGRDDDAVARLREALALAPETATVRYALGLALHRTGHAQEALAEFARAAQSAPDQPQLTLAWALSLDAAGRRGEAIDALAAAIDEERGSGDLRHALVSLLRDDGQLEQARGRLQQWLEQSPDDPRAKSLAAELGGRS